MHRLNDERAIREWIREHKIEVPWDNHIRVYKAVASPREDGRYHSWYNPRKCYQIGSEVVARRLTVNDFRRCGEGLHVSTYNWSKKFGRERLGEYSVLSCIVCLDDRIVIPKEWMGNKKKWTCEKIRVGRLVVEGEVMKASKHAFIRRCY